MEETVHYSEFWCGNLLENSHLEDKGDGG